MIHADKALQMGRDHFFLVRTAISLFMVRTAIPQHVKAVLNLSESGAVSSAMSEDGVGSSLVVTLGAIKPIGRTRLINGDAVKNPVCATHRRRHVSVLKELSE